MPYIPHSEEDISKILASAGAASVDEMLDGVPADLRLKDPLDLPPGLSEQELTRVMKGLCRKNSTVDSGCSSFLGAGAYNHYIPSVVAHMAGRAEFYTAYTPYQPEISQGTLQAIFEYQTLVCQLTGMDVSNASLYDGASAAAEAVLMARRITGKERVLLSAALHPEYGETVKTYLRGAGDRVGTVLYCAEKGTTLPEAVEAAMTDDTACLVVQHPNFFGCLEEARALADIVHGKKALLITVSSEAVSFGLLKPPGELGADIAAGDNQSFGNQLNFGGPYLGFMATKTEFIRQMPGRLVGQTVDRKGKRAFCLTFATREQHIRRERATSNICTNNGLSALQAAIHMTSLGRMGLKTLAHLNLSKAAYLRERLLEVKGAEAGFTSPVFNEFTIRLDNIDADEALKRLLKKGIIGGLGLGRFYPELKRHLLIAATEMNTRPEMDRFAEELSKI